MRTYKIGLILAGTIYTGFFVFSMVRAEDLKVPPTSYLPVAIQESFLKC